MDFLDRLYGIPSSIKNDYKEAKADYIKKSKNFENLYFSQLATNIGINRSILLKDFYFFINNTFTLPTQLFEKDNFMENIPAEIKNVFQEGGSLYDEVYTPTKINFETPIKYFLKEIIDKYVFQDFENYIERVTTKKYNGKYTDAVYKKETIIMLYVRTMLILSDAGYIQKKYVNSYSDYFKKNPEFFKTVHTNIEDFDTFLGGDCFYDEITTNLYYSICFLLLENESEDIKNYVLAPIRKTQPELINYVDNHDEIDAEKIFFALLSADSLDYIKIMPLLSEFTFSIVMLYAEMCGKKITNMEKYVLICTQYADIDPFYELYGTLLRPNYIRKASDYFDKEFETIYSNSTLSPIGQKYMSLLSYSLFKVCTNKEYIKYQFLKSTALFGMLLLNNPNTTYSDASKIAYTYLFSDEKEKTIEDYQKINKILLKMLLIQIYKSASDHILQGITRTKNFIKSVQLVTDELDYDDKTEKMKSEKKENIEKAIKDNETKHQSQINDLNHKIQEQALIIERLAKENDKLKSILQKEQKTKVIETIDIPELDETEKEDQIALEEMVSFLQDYRIRYTGGHPVVLNKLKQIFPEWDFYESGKGYHWNENELFKKTDYCVIHYVRMSHSEFNKIMRGVENYDTPIIYVKNNNIESIISVIYNRVQEELMKKEAKQYDS